MLVYLSEENAKFFVDFAEKEGFGMAKPIKELADAIKKQL